MQNTLTSVPLWLHRCTRPMEPQWHSQEKRANECFHFPQWWDSSDSASHDKQQVAHAPPPWDLSQNQLRRRSCAVLCRCCVSLNNSGSIASNFPLSPQEMLFSFCDVDVKTFAPHLYVFLMSWFVHFCFCCADPQMTTNTYGHHECWRWLWTIMLKQNVFVFLKNFDGVLISMKNVKVWLPLCLERHLHWVFFSSVFP